MLLLLHTALLAPAARSRIPLAQRRRQWRGLALAQGAAAARDRRAGANGGDGTALSRLAAAGRTLAWGRPTRRRGAGAAGGAAAAGAVKHAAAGLGAARWVGLGVGVAVCAAALVGASGLGPLRVVVEASFGGGEVRVDTGGGAATAVFIRQRGVAAQGALASEAAGPRRAGLIGVAALWELALAVQCTTLLGDELSAVVVGGRAARAQGAVRLGAAVRDLGVGG